MRAEGSFTFMENKYGVIDLPGTYSLLAMTVDEEIARDFLLFGRPDVTVVIVDATTLERNLNLALQILEITDRVVVCLNLMDEANRKGLKIDVDRLSIELGVPVVPTVANRGRGINDLVAVIAGVASGAIPTVPHRIVLQEEIREVLDEVVPLLEEQLRGLPNARWVVLRLLEGDPRIREALERGEIGVSSQKDIWSRLSEEGRKVDVDSELADVLSLIDRESAAMQPPLHESLTASIYADATAIASRTVTTIEIAGVDWDSRLDRILTSRKLGFPIMFALLAGVFWITIEGANVPSALLAEGFFWLEDQMSLLFSWLGAPWWVEGVLVHGTFRGLAWVVSVMLPPMAIFFPLFTILEDLGYLPRVAFNLDRFFKSAGGHGKQALTMCMGFGCNAAGVISCRIIGSPRERLVAILTNVFMPCNGRWPTLILMAAVFVVAGFPSAVSSLVAASVLVLVTVVGIIVTFVVSALLSRTILKGESSFFALELPPYRRPQIGRILYTSLIDRTIFVLWRAVKVAAPIGALIWILGNVYIEGTSLMAHLANALSPMALLIGLDGFILLAFIMALPANEIVIPTLIMGYMGAGMMMELGSTADLASLFAAQGFTVLTAISLMLFSLLHWPCLTTTLTVWRETGSAKWTLASNLIPLATALLVTFVFAQSAFLLGFG